MKTSSVTPSSQLFVNFYKIPSIVVAKGVSKKSSPLTKRESSHVLVGSSSGKMRVTEHSVYSVIFTQAPVCTHILHTLLHQQFACVLSRVQFFVTPWMVAHQAPLPMEFSREEYWRRVPFPTPGDLLDPGI